MVFHTTGVMLSRNNIHYLSGLCNDLEELDGITKKNSTEKMMHYLKRKKFNHMVLYHDGSHNQLMNVCQDESKKQWINLPPKEDEDLQQFINAHRQVFGVKHHQALFIGLAWVIPIEQKFFEHFPEVICVDTVSDTNKDKRPLLTISGKDSFGKMFIILRAFLPNERAWVFRWIFTIVLPTLFPRNLLSQVKAIITDGCPQEFMQIDTARQIYFKNALRMKMPILSTYSWASEGDFTTTTWFPVLTIQL